MPALGNEFKVVPSLKFQEVYNDNIYYSSDEKKDGFVHALITGLLLEENSERLSSRFSARLENKKSSKNYNVGNTDQFYKGHFSYRLTPRFSVSGGMDYIEDSRNDRDYEEIDVPLEDMDDATGRYIDSRVTKYTHGYNASLSYYLSERLSSAISWNYDRDDFSDTYEEAFENTVHRFQFTLAYDLSSIISRTVIQFGGGLDDYAYKGATGTYDDIKTDYDSKSCRIGISREFTQKSGMNVELGVRDTSAVYRYSYPDSWGWPDLKSNSDETGLVGSLRFHSNGEYVKNSFSINRNITDASDSDSVINRTSCSYHFVWRTFPDFRIGFHAGYSLSESEGNQNSNKIDEKLYNVKAFGRYHWNKNVYLEVSYSGRRLEDRVDNKEVDRNMVFLSLGWEPESRK